MMQHLKARIDSRILKSREKNISGGVEGTFGCESGNYFIICLLTIIKSLHSLIYRTTLRVLMP